LNHLELNFLDEPMTTLNLSTRILKIGALMASCFLMPIALANSPVGQWQTSDEKTGELKSVVIIFEQQGVMKGRVEKILRKDADPAAKCDKCSSGKNVWEDGEILDPENGRTYALRLTPIENGAKLEVRGSFGPIGRTQTWVRVP
jgi:uncharacterized protein (DUF2147 family)